MTTYKFEPYNILDETVPVFTKKGAGESFKYISIKLKNGKVFKGHNIFDNYVRAIYYIGLDKAARIAYYYNINSGGAPIISRKIEPKWTKKYKSFELEGYHILKIKANSYRALLNRLSETYDLGIKVELL